VPGPCEAVTVSKLPSCPAFRKRLNERSGRRPFNLTGKQFGRLRVLTYAGPCKERKTLQWLCQCSCGERKVVCTPDLMNSGVRSCGCVRGRTTHGKRWSVEYSTWVALKQRCLNPKSKAYKDYGGRGITVCDRWRGPQGFQNFLADMGVRPRGKTIDRKDVNGNYEPQNCRWATSHMQAINKRPRKPAAPSPQADVAAITGVEEPF